MGLVQVDDWFNKKSVKLSDAFIVVFDGNESFRCAGFTIPKVAEWNEQVHKFGNTSHKMLIPKIDMVQELSIELYEGYTRKNNGEILQTAQNSFFWKLTNPGGFNVGAGFFNYSDYDSTGYNMLKGDYKRSAVDVKHLEIYVLDNNLRKAVYKYTFRNLKLTKFTPYELSYNDESITKWSLSFVFESFTKESDNTPAAKLG